MSLEVREQGTKERRCVLHFGEELFATIGAAKHGYDALNMHNVFRKIPRREGDVAEEGQWRRVVELRLQFIIALWFHQLHLQGAGASSTGKCTKSKVAVNSLKSAVSGQIPAKRAGSDVCVHVCYENVLALQLHAEGVHVRSDVRQQG